MASNLRSRDIQTPQGIVMTTKINRLNLIKPVAFAVAAAVFLNGCIIHVGGPGSASLDHSEQVLTLDATNLKQLQADTGAGALIIQGEAGRTQIEVVAQIYNNEESELILTLEKQGDAAKLVADFDRSFSYGNSPYIDLVVKVPASFALTLDDGSGDVDIKGLQGALRIDDGSGDLFVDNGASLVLDDGSGDIRISHIQGDVKVDDGSGDINISQISGIVTIDDGSGDIRVEQSLGLTIDDDGSGDLNINQINGPVNIAED